MKNYDPKKIKEKNKDLLLFLNIESREAVANLESMLAIDGVDGIFIGPHDLSVSMNCPEEWENAEYQETISYILKTARKMGKAAGCHWSFTNGVENQQKWMKEDGANLCIHSADVQMYMDKLAADMNVLQCRSKNVAQQNEHI